MIKTTALLAYMMQNSFNFRFCDHYFLSIWKECYLTQSWEFIQRDANSELKTTQISPFFSFNWSSKGILVYLKPSQDEMRNMFDI